MTQYQGLLCENPLVKLEVVWTLNPATFLPDKAGPLDHDCLEILDEVFSRRPDLMDKLDLTDKLQKPDLVLYTDGSSFMENGKRLAGYAMVPDSEVVEADALPRGWSAQRVELVCILTQLMSTETLRKN